MVGDSFEGYCVRYRTHLGRHRDSASWQYARNVVDFSSKLIKLLRVFEFVRQMHVASIQKAHNS